MGIIFSCSLLVDIFSLLDNALVNVFDITLLLIPVKPNSLVLLKKIYNYKIFNGEKKKLYLKFYLIFK